MWASSCAGTVDHGTRRPVSEVVVFRFPMHFVIARLALTGGVVLAAVVAIALPAVAGTCSYDAGTRTVTASIGPNDQELRLVANGSNLEAGGVTCASLSAIETVNVSMAQRPDGTATFDLGHGPLGPGFSNEGDGSSEIEFSVSSLANFGSIKVLGSSGN